MLVEYKIIILFKGSRVSVSKAFYFVCRILLYIFVYHRGVRSERGAVRPGVPSFVTR